MAKEVTFRQILNCSRDIKMFSNSQPSASNFKRFSRSLEIFFITVGQNNFGNKIPFLTSLVCVYVCGKNTYANSKNLHQENLSCDIIFIQCKLCNEKINSKHQNFLLSYINNKISCFSVSGFLSC